MKKGCLILGFLFCYPGAPGYR